MTFSEQDLVMFETLAKTDLADLVAAKIRAAILNADYAVGDLLPPERELATQFGVNRTTVREALNEMEHLGLVERRQGIGCRVLDYRETGSLELLRYLVTDPSTGLIDMAIASQVADFFEAFLALVVRAAATAADDGDIQALEEIVAGVLQAAPAGDTYLSAEMLSRFLRRMIKASHSVVLELAGNAILRAFDIDAGTAGSVLRGLADHAGDDPGALDDLRGLVGALESHDAESALNAVGDVMERLRGVIAERRN